MKQLMNKIISTIAATACLTGCSASLPKPLEEYDGGALFDEGGAKVVCLYGTWEQMGRQWGSLGRESMGRVLDFIQAGTRGHEAEVASTADALYSHYPEYLRSFMQAASESSGLSLEQLKSINAVEWNEAYFACTGIACWGPYSADGSLVYGRNYDAHKYRDIGSEIVVMVFHPEGGQAFATVGYAGEIYCLNGLNESGLFVELNNGMPSAGTSINFDISVSTTELMRLIATARTFDDVDKFFATTPSAAGFLIGVADAREARSYEWFGEHAMRGDTTTPDGLMLMTNHYVCPDWEFATPTDADSWDSISRREAILAFAAQRKGTIDAATMRTYMRVPVASGGPKLNDLDMYQLVVEPAQRLFWLNIPGVLDWAPVDLKKYF